MARWVWLAMVGCVACGGEAAGSSRDPAGADGSPSCVDGQEQACTCDDGGSGTRRCASGWGACDCTDSDFGNPDPVVTLPSADAGGGLPVNPDRLDNCDPGFYLGTYNCNVMTGAFSSPLMGDVSFNLEIDETQVASECDAEFCPDLVISESSGILFGLAGFIGFEAKLEGGLDCSTGVFRASAPSGIYGFPISSDPNDPNAPWTVQQPPTGMFSGTLAGMHLGGDPQVIEGDWDLMEAMMGSGCAGPFTVQLQP